jgi:hypothetical protein
VNARPQIDEPADALVAGRKKMQKFHDVLPKTFVAVEVQGVIVAGIGKRRRPRR